jgi:hypothetical protein
MLLSNGSFSHLGLAEEKAGSRGMARTEHHLSKTQTAHTPIVNTRKHAPVAPSSNIPGISAAAAAAAKFLTFQNP